MDEPTVTMVAGRPRLGALVGRARWWPDYTGHRIEGGAPGMHHGLPSRHLTVIVTLEFASVRDSQPGSGAFSPA